MYSSIHNICTVHGYNYTNYTSSETDIAPKYNRYAILKNAYALLAYVTGSRVPRVLVTAKLCPLGICLSRHITYALK